LPGDTAEVVVPADQSWTATGLYLEPEPAICTRSPTTRWASTATTTARYDSP
jgi:hypothetical protein